MDLGAGGQEIGGALVRACEAERPMAGRDQLANDGRADESGGAGDKDTHGKVSWFGLRPLSAPAISW